MNTEADTPGRQLAFRIAEYVATANGYGEWDKHMVAYEAVKVAVEEARDDTLRVLGAYDPLAMREWCDALTSRLEAVKALHRQVKREGGLIDEYCPACSRRWPCPTYLAASSSDLPEGDTT